MTEAREENQSGSFRDDPWTFTGDFSSLRRIDVARDAQTWTVFLADGNDRRNGSLVEFFVENYARDHVKRSRLALNSGSLL